MHRGKTPGNRTGQSNLRQTIDKLKPNYSKHKHKKLIQTHSVSNRNGADTLTISPHTIKQLNEDKQNSSIVQTAFKIMAAAGETKQKQILLSLATQLYKQQKIQSFISQKQNSSDILQLQKMLSHIRHQQNKLVGNLKLQVGRRKLQSLNDNSLREDMLNFYCYIMNKTKKQAIDIKNQGIDWLGELLHKFQEQQRIISNIEHFGDKNYLKAKSLKQKMEDRQYQFNVTQKLKPKQITDHLNRKLNDSNKISSQESERGPQNVLKQKLQQSQKQNKRLRKQIKKIEQEFECLVEQKLLLEQQIQRNNSDEKKRIKKYNKNCKQLKQQLAQLKQFQQNSRQSIIELIELYLQEKQKYQYQIYIAINDTNNNQIVWQADKSIHQKGQQSDRYDDSPLSDNSETIKQKGNIVIEDKYEFILAQKQLQINKYLKIISVLNEKVKEQEDQISHIKSFSDDKLKTISILKQKVVYLGLQIKQFQKQFSNSFQALQSSHKEFVNELNLKIQHRYNQQESHNLIIQKYEKQMMDKIQQIIGFTNENKQIKQLNQELKANMRRKQLQYEQKKYQNQKNILSLFQLAKKIENILSKTDQNIGYIIQNNQQTHPLCPKQKFAGRQFAHEGKRCGENSNPAKITLENIIQFLQYNILSFQRVKIISLGEYNKMMQQNLNYNQRCILSEGGTQIKQKQIINEDLTLQNSLLLEEVKRVKEQSSQFYANNSSKFELPLEPKQNKIEKQIIQIKLSQQNSQWQQINNYQKSHIKQQHSAQSPFNFALHELKTQVSNTKMKINQLQNFVQIIKREYKLSIQQFSNLFQKFVINFTQFKFFNSQKIKLQTRTVDMMIVPECNHQSILLRITQICQLLINQSSIIHNESILFDDLYKKLQLLKKFIEKSKKQNNTKIQLANPQLQQICDDQQKKNANSNQSCQFNNIECVTPQVDHYQNKDSHSSFLKEYRQSKNDFLQSGQAFLFEILNESVINQQIVLLRLELMESFKEICHLTEQLKLYQQKDMDKIFDF